MTIQILYKTKIKNKAETTVITQSPARFKYRLKRKYCHNHFNQDQSRPMCCLSILFICILYVMVLSDLLVLCTLSYTLVVSQLCLLPLLLSLSPGCSLHKLTSHSSLALWSQLTLTGCTELLNLWI